MIYNHIMPHQNIYIIPIFDIKACNKHLNKINMYMILAYSLHNKKNILLTRIFIYIYNYALNRNVYSTEEAHVLFDCFVSIHERYARCPK